MNSKLVAPFLHTCNVVTQHNGIVILAVQMTVELYPEDSFAGGMLFNGEQSAMRWGDTVLAPAKA